MMQYSADDILQSTNSGQPSLHHVLTRKHIPSQAEFRQSLRLIEQLRDEIAALQLQINGAQKARDAREAEITCQVEAQITNLRDQLAADVQALDHSTAMVTEPLQLRLEDTEKRLGFEQQFISAMRKVPPEILIEIFKWHLDCEIPPRRLALVCKEWRALLLETPSLWENISAQYVGTERVEQETAILLRRIELARSAPLNITISSKNYRREGSSPALLNIVSSIEVNRWRSLTLQGITSWNSPPPLVISPVGQFLRLRTLKLRPSVDKSGENEPDPFIPIYQKIAQTCPSLEDFELDGDLPAILQNAGTCRNIKRLKAELRTVMQLHPLHHLEELEVTGYHIDNGFDPLLFPPLPAKTILEPPIPKVQFSTLQLHLVQSLHISNFQPRDFTGTLQLPLLQTLEISNGDIWNIYRIDAPRLTKLSIHKYYRNSARGVFTKEVAELFKTPSDHLSIMPTTLDIDLALGPTAFNAILDHWSQIQHLTITYGKEFPWKNSFASSLSRGSLGRNLVALRLIAPQHVFELDWREVAYRILNARKNTAFKSIEFKNAFEEWEKVTTD